MFVKPTVLVLGAGASVQYGYPLGGQLVSQILTLHDDSYFMRERARARINPGHFREFIDTVAAAMPASIDSFLEHRREFLEIGKLAIAYLIIRHEGSSIRDRDRADKWYGRLLNFLGDSPEKIAKNNLAIVTFNYDRSLDYFLHSAVCARYDLTDKATANVLSSIPILHIYGSVGSFPWQEESRGGQRPWGFNEREPGLAINAAQGIRIIFEDKHDQQVLERAKLLIADAEDVFVLGFGFHEENCRRIGLKRNKPTSANGCGISETVRHGIAGEWNIKFSGQSHDDIRHFFDNCRRFYSAASAKLGSQ